MEHEASIDQALAEARQHLARLYGERLRRVILFGSQARGDARPDSDIDVLVVLAGPVHLYTETKRLVHLERMLFERYRFDFSFRVYDEEAYQDTERRFIRTVHEEGVAL